MTVSLEHHNTTNSLAAAAIAVDPDTVAPVASAHTGDPRRDLSLAYLRGIYPAGSFGFLAICRPDQTRPKSPMLSRHFVVTDLEAAAAYALAEDAAGHNTYVTMVAHGASLSERRRGKRDEKVCAAVLWADIDKKGPGHAANALPETQADLVEILKAVLPFEPSMITDTGGGWHIVWRLDAPVDLRKTKARDEFQAVSKALQKRLIAAAKSRGWHLDDTSDLTRVLRPTGTHNHKPGRAAPPLVAFVIRPEEGVAYDYRTIARELLAAPAAHLVPVIVKAPTETAPTENTPAESGTALDAEATQSRIRDRMKRNRKPDRKAVLKAFIDGTPWARRGERDAMAQRLASWIAWYTEGQGDIGAIMAMAGPSLAAMNAEGGGDVADEWFEDKVVRAMDDARRKAAEKKAADGRMTAVLVKGGGAGTSSTPTVTVGGADEPESPQGKVRRYLVEYTEILTGYSGPIRYNERTGDITIGGTVVSLDELVPIIQSRTGLVKEALIWDKKAETVKAPSWPAETVYSQLLSLAMAARFDPVIEMLDRLPKWDGVDHVLELVEALHVKESHPIYTEYLRVMLIGSIARARRPGCKFDTSLILHEPSGGKKKDSFFLHLYGEENFSDSPFSVGGGGNAARNSEMKINRVWCNCSSEMQMLKTARDRESLKAFQSRTEDCYVRPYGRGHENHKRRSVFVGTSNESLLFSRDGGNRRWHLIPNVGHGGKIDLDVVDRVREQVWAQADAEFAAGNTWWFEGAAEETHSELQEEHTLADIGTGRLAKWLEQKNETTIDEVMSAADAPDLFRPHVYRGGQNGVARILRALGFEDRRVRREGKPTRLWTRTTPVERERVFGDNVIPLKTSSSESDRGAA